LRRNFENVRNKVMTPQNILFITNSTAEFVRKLKCSGTGIEGLQIFARFEKLDERFLVNIRDVEVCQVCNLPRKHVPLFLGSVAMTNVQSFERRTQIDCFEKKCVDVSIQSL
jgi:hypothetical protein